MKMTEAKQKKLKRMVAKIKKGQLAFLDICRSLHIIESEKLHGSGSLVKFCIAEFDMTDTEISRYRAAAGVLNDLGEQEVLPSNEGQCRQLVVLKSASRRKQVWDEVLKRHQKGEKITAELIKSVAGTEPSKKKKAGKGDPVKLIKVVTSHLAILASMSLERLNEKQLTAIHGELKTIIATAKTLESDLKDVLGKYNPPKGF